MAVISNHLDIFRLSLPQIGQPALFDENLAAKVHFFIKAWFREMLFWVTTIGVTIHEKIYGDSPECTTPSGNGNQWKNGSRGLYVAIHGVNGRPNIWRDQLTALREKEPDCDIRLPYVPRAGNCSLEESVAPIEAMIRDYIRTNPLKPVCLLGVSNGARIAAELEIRLRDTRSPIKLSTVAGALAGTKNMDRMDEWGVARFRYTPSFIEEMRFQSATATQLMRRMNAPFNAVPRSYDFFASPQDCLIDPYTGSFPPLENKDANYFAAPGENHNSIVSKVCSLQIERCKLFVNTHCVQH